MRRFFELEGSSDIEEFMAEDEEEEN